MFNWIVLKYKNLSLMAEVEELKYENQILREDKIELLEALDFIKKLKESK